MCTFIVIVLLRILFDRASQVRVRFIPQVDKFLGPVVGLFGNLTAHMPTPCDTHRHLSDLAERRVDAPARQTTTAAAHLDWNRSAIGPIQTDFHPAEHPIETRPLPRHGTGE